MAEKNIRNTHPNNLGISQIFICLHPIPSGLLFDLCILELANCSQSRNYLVPCFPDPLQPDPLQPDPLLPRSPLVSCLLSSVFCVLPSPLRPLVSYWPRPALYICRDSSTNPPLFCKTNPMSKIGKMNRSPATQKTYGNKQRTMNNERCSKQTQSNPIPPPPNFAAPAHHPHQASLQTTQ